MKFLTCFLSYRANATGDVLFLNHLRTVFCFAKETGLCKEKKLNKGKGGKERYTHLNAEFQRIE